MRVLCDTNVFIALEDQHVLQSKYVKLLEILAQREAEILLHQSIADDIERDRDQTRKKSSLSKLAKYRKLEEVEDCSEVFDTTFGIQTAKDNDRVDCELLCAVYRDAVDILITEDHGIHSKAKKLGISDRVFYVQQAIHSFDLELQPRSISIPNIEEIYVHQIRDELSRPFFDSLREDYPGFDNWFIEKCCRAGRKAWIYRGVDTSIGALCIIKECEDEIVTSDSKALAGKSLKLCTFKVASEHQGKKIGELFLKAAIRYSALNRITSIFLTMKDTQKHLQMLVEDFGFQNFGVDPNLDVVFVKSQPVNPPSAMSDPFYYHRMFSPHIQASPEVRKFIVPIVPEFHRMLFPDWSFPTEVTQLQLPLNVDFGQVPGNAIKLAYISRSNIRKIDRGDVLLFYRSKDAKVITSIGVVESAERLKDADKIFSRVRKRTVYDIEEIRRLAKNGCLVILFRSAVHFEGRISARDLEQIGVIGPIQSIREMSHEQFEQLVQSISFKNCILAH